MYYWDDDDLVKQKLAAEFEKYTMSQKEAAEFLSIHASAMNNLIIEKRLIPLYTYNATSSRKMNIFFKQDVVRYKETLDIIRANRKNRENT
ncbi:DNA-binding protein [Listeria booriae]|uniref:DNA-binding protein n=1 Tax=Listeria booriae TaxID=1552123 RepID=UPI00288052E4|nr:DNA-binding protein [Listeria booriae]MDT0109327.1 DNA-binding protein [Listeria booriae]